MLFSILHRTSYRFNSAVFLEPHVLRLRPRCDTFQDLEGYSLEVTPAPAGRSDGYDPEGNNVTVLWFDGTTRELEIVSEATVRTLRSNPFDYLLTFSGSARLPMTYPSWEEAPLQHYRRDTGHDGVDRLAARISRKVGNDTLAFIGELNSMIYSKWKVTVREEGDPLPPQETLRRGEGSCRDLTVLFMAACRAVGIASRFTSGYQEGDPDQERRYMHAWPEVYLPGAGWRGYDPTLGLAVSDRHVALASGALPLEASPTQGTFRGTGASSEMEVNLTIRTSP